MIEEDHVRHSRCPNCGYTLQVSVQKDIEVGAESKGFVWSCFNCGCPLALDEGLASTGRHGVQVDRSEKENLNSEMPRPPSTEPESGI